MKFLPAALFLACSALACRFAMQPDASPARFDVSARRRAAAPPAAPLFERIFPLPRVPSAPSADVAMALAPPKPSPKPRLSHADAMALIEKAAAKHGVAVAFVRSIVAAESNFDCNAVSPKGAIGLMQLMPGTARHFGADPTVPEQNIDAGTRYLRELMLRYQHDRQWLRRVIAAYNVGPAIVDRYDGVPPFPETRDYVERVLGLLHNFALLGTRAARG